ncbi:hypothetical protein CSUI_004837, partial [Cystoisospora suis]
RRGKNGRRLSGCEKDRTERFSFVVIETEGSGSSFHSMEKRKDSHGRPVVTEVERGGLF